MDRHRLGDGGIFGGGAVNRQKQEALAEKIKKRQGLLGWNRKEMARHAAVSLSVLGNALDGQGVSDEKMRQICEAVGVEFDSVPEEQPVIEQQQPVVEQQQTVVEQQENEIAELRAQIEQLQKALCATATERDDAVKELCKERRKREEAEKAAERAANAVQGAKAGAEEARRELRDLKASLFDDMREELRRTKEELARLEENAI
jgi:chromosome segregation ATPase